MTNIERSGLKGTNAVMQERPQVFLLEIDENLISEDVTLEIAKEEAYRAVNIAQKIREWLKEILA